MEVTPPTKPKKVEVVTVMSTSDPDVITDSQDPMITSLLQEYESLFAKSSFDLGRIELEQHRILLTDDVPVARSPYRQSFRDAEETARQVKELLAKGLIRISSSAYATPTTLADKKDGSRRFVCDYRGVNSKTIPDKTPLPVIADFVDRLQGSKFFSKLDFASGYWQVPIHPDDIHKTAFVTPDGHYEWLVLPFGLKNAPATFHRVVQSILQDFINQGVMSYLDRPSSFTLRLARITIDF